MTPIDQNLFIEIQQQHSKLQTDKPNEPNSPQNQLHSPPPSLKNSKEDLPTISENKVNEVKVIIFQDNKLNK